MDEFKTMAIFTVLITILWIGVVGWLTGSVITSGVKAFNNDCDKRYGIEKVVAGNWFCPLTEDK